MLTLATLLSRVNLRTTEISLIAKVADMSEQEEIKQRVTEAEYAATSATGDANITITNRW